MATLAAPMVDRALPSATASRSGLLQRCGGHPCPPTGCTEERDGETRLQRFSSRPPLAGEAPPIVHSVLRSGGHPIDPQARLLFEAQLGHNFAHVRIHTGSAADDATRSVHAIAFTVGNHVVMGSAAGDATKDARATVLRHELAHVVQQGGHLGARSLPDQIAIGSLESPLEAEADAAATTISTESGPRSPRHAWGPALLSRIAEPYITNVSVNLTAPESATLAWKGTAPSGPGTDSFTVSTGKGYSDPGDPPGTCTRTCCADPESQCAPPYDRPKAVGSCCTPIGDNFWTGTPRTEHNGWKYWTPVEPIHTSGGRGIALHQHDEVTGQAIGHGCIRMDEANAERIFRYARGKATAVAITGRAKVSCPSDRQCAKTGGLERPEQGARLAQQEEPLTAPDQEPPGPGGAPTPAMGTEGAQAIV